MKKVKAKPKVYLVLEFDNLFHVTTIVKIHASRDAAEQHALGLNINSKKRRVFTAAKLKPDWLTYGVIKKSVEGQL